MAGVAFKVTVRDREVRSAMRKLGLEGDRVINAALKNIGQALVQSTRKRFAREEAPDGTAWQKLNPEYAKTKRGAKILQEQGMRGGLLGTIVWQLGARQVEVGTNKVYAAIHQFGGTIVPKRADFLAFRLGGRLVFARKVTIPARPFLGISAADRGKILDIVADHIAQVWEGRGGD